MSAQITTEQKIIKNKVAPTRIGQTARKRTQSMNDSRILPDSFYRYKGLYETDGETAPQKISRKPYERKNALLAAVLPDDRVLLFLKGMALHCWASLPTVLQSTVAHEKTMSINYI